MKRSKSTKSNSIPLQELLHGEYLRVTRLHKDLHSLSVVPHRHDHYELILVKEGAGRHTINFHPFELIPDRLYFIHKGQVHLIEDFERDGWIILFGEELFSRFQKLNSPETNYGIMDTFGQQPFVDLDDQMKQTFHVLISQIEQELAIEKPDPDILLYYVTLLLLHANRIHLTQHPHETLNLHSRQLFLELKQLIETHFRQQHQAAFYARALHMDIKKLNKICQNAAGMNLSELLKDRLLTECKILLQTSATSIKQISYDLGFKDPAFFGRFFKRETGHSPGRFRHIRL